MKYAHAIPLPDYRHRTLLAGRVHFLPRRRLLACPSSPPDTTPLTVFMTLQQLGSNIDDVLLRTERHLSPLLRRLTGCYGSLTVT